MAGSFSIQGCASMLEKEVSGDDFNVVGLPICRPGQMLTQFGLYPLGLFAQKEQA